VRDDDPRVASGTRRGCCAGSVAAGLMSDGRRGLVEPYLGRLTLGARQAQPSAAGPWDRVSRLDDLEEKRAAHVDVGVVISAAALQGRCGPDWMGAGAVSARRACWIGLESGGGEPERLAVRVFVLVKASRLLRMVREEGRGSAG